MSRNKLFNIIVPLSPNHAMLKDEAGASPSVAVGVINSNQSAITFAGAPVLVTIVWKIVGMMAPSIMDSIVFPVALSLAIGMLIYWQSAPKGTSTKDIILGFIFALLNSFAIAAAVLGIQSTTGGINP